MPEISIIIPVYKAEKYLKRCVDSILSQTFSDFDVVLVDDGSPDNSLFICNEYAAKDDRIHVIHQDNSGPSVARNNGLNWAFQYSSSRYLTFVDSDDCLHPQFLEYLYYAIAKTNAQIGMCHHQYIAMEDRFYNRQLYSQIAIKEISAEDLMIAQSGSFNYAWGKLYLKKSFETVRYPDEVSFGEDNLIIFRVLFEATKLVYVDNDLYFYFYTPTGITKSPWTPRSLDVFKGIEVQLKYYKEKGYIKAYEKELELYIQQYAYQIHRIRRDKVSRKKNVAYICNMRRNMKRLLNENTHCIREQFYWYEALYPFRATVLKIAGKIKRKILCFYENTIERRDN